MDRIKELENLLRQASEAYYNSGEPVMTDAEFDRLFDELRELDPTNEFLDGVGANVRQNKAKHRISMGSLKKIKNSKELQTW